MTIKVVWRKVPQKHGPAFMIARVGLINVGNVYYNAMRKQGAVGTDYKYVCVLPGLKTSSGVVPSENDGIQTIENMVQAWFKASLGE